MESYSIWLFCDWYISCGITSSRFTDIITILQNSLPKAEQYSIGTDQILFFDHTMWHVELVSPRGIRPMPPALEAQSLNHWTTRDIPNIFFLNYKVSSNKYNWYKQFVYHFLCFLIQYSFPNYMPWKVRQLNMILMPRSVYYIRSIKKPINIFLTNKYVAYSVD